MNMTYTDEQMKILAAFEEHFRTAVNSGWSRYPGQAALQTIYGIFTQATGDRRQLKASCATCVLHLLQDAGRLYFEQKGAKTPTRRRKSANDKSIANEKKTPNTAK